VLEECVAEGIAVAATVSFTVPQAIAIAERHRAGALRARQKGIQPGPCFAVIMIGRLDDFLREVAHDARAAADESDIRQAGLAATKRAYSIYRERGYEAVLLVAALRGDYHLTELAGAICSCPSRRPGRKSSLPATCPARSASQTHPAAVIERLCGMPDFVRAFEPDGMTPSDFMDSAPPKGPSANSSMRDGN